MSGPGSSEAPLPTDPEVGSLVHDLRAGSVVFLVALPLCLGIALASGAPPLAGLITGIVGGLVVSLLSGSSLAVSGPAAGLALIVLDGINDLGYAPFLVAVFLCGAIQLALGLARAGVIVYYFPNAVIKGLLAAIGAILIRKELPHAFGWADGISKKVYGGEMSFGEVMTEFQTGAVIIAVLGLAIMILWPMVTRGRKLESLPAALLVVGTGILLNLAYGAAAPDMALEGERLVNIPKFSSWADYRQMLPGPDWSVITMPAVWATAGVLAVIASIETLLSVEAIDKLDPWRRKSPASRELSAQGVGNMVAGFLGGIPMTAVIVRGSANVHSGGRTKKSAFFHAVLLVLAVLLIPNILGMIPVAALGAVLLFIGYRLMPIPLFKKMWELGPQQFAPFIATFTAILMTDLMRGTFIGLSVGLLFIAGRVGLGKLKEHMAAPFVLEELVDNEVRLTLGTNLTFLNKARVTKGLEEIKEGAHVVIDASASDYVDRDVLDIIEEFRTSAANNNQTVELEGMKKHGLYVLEEDAA